VNLSEALAPATVNAGNRMVWSYNGHFYTLTQTSETWGAAETEAQSLNGQLVKVDDALEQQWLTATFERFGSVWIGRMTRRWDNTWVWADGMAVTYANWASGQPYNWGYEMTTTSPLWAAAGCGTMFTTAIPIGASSSWPPPTPTATACRRGGPLSR